MTIEMKHIEKKVNNDCDGAVMHFATTPPFTSLQKLSLKSAHENHYLLTALMNGQCPLRLRGAGGPRIASWRDG